MIKKFESFKPKRLEERTETFLKNAEKTANFGMDNVELWARVESDKKQFLTMSEKYVETLTSFNREMLVKHLKTLEKIESAISKLEHRVPYAHTIYDLLKKGRFYRDSLKVSFYVDMDIYDNKDMKVEIQKKEESVIKDFSIYLHIPDEAKIFYPHRITSSRTNSKVEGTYKFLNDKNFILIEFEILEKDLERMLDVLTDNPIVDLKKISKTEYNIIGK